MTGPKVCPQAPRDGLKASTTLLLRYSLAAQQGGGPTESHGTYWSGVVVSGRWLGPDDLKQMLDQAAADAAR